MGVLLGGLVVDLNRRDFRARAVRHPGAGDFHGAELAERDALKGGSHVRAAVRGRRGGQEGG